MNERSANVIAGWTRVGLVCKVSWAMPPLPGRFSETDTGGYKRDSLSQPNDTDPYRPMIEDIETRKKGRYRMI